MDSTLAIRARTTAKRQRMTRCSKRGFPHPPQVDEETIAASRIALWLATAWAVSSRTVAISNGTSITINRILDVMIVTTLDRNTSEISTDTFIGDSSFGK
jgi:hypothetical protein